MDERKPRHLDAEGLWNYALRALGGRAHSSGEMREKLGRRAERENVLVLHGAVEAEALAELPFEINHIHPRTGPLDRIQDVDPHLDQQGQERPATAVVMMEDLDPELVA